MFGMKAAPYIGDLARKADNEVPFGSFGDITTTSRYKAAEKALRYSPNIDRVVRDSLSRNVALALQRHHPELCVRTDGALVVDLKGAVQPSWNTDTERYRNFGDPISMFDFSAHTTFYQQFYDQRVLTHQYQNNARNLNADKKYIMYN